MAMTGHGRMSLDATAEEPAIVIADRYKAMRTLGQGGMGVVYEAWDTRLRRLVALKLLKADNDHEGAAERMFREARVMAALEHENVVSAFDVGMHGGEVFIAMRLIQGTTLRRWAEVERTHSDKLRVLIGAGRGLAAAHAAKIIHRDFKPDNVLIDATGTARVTDFGIARRLEATTGIDPLISTHLTQSGVFLGTPAYMAPEQSLGRAVTGAADQFSFCVTVWELFAGQRPFPGANATELFANVLAGEIAPAATATWPAGLERALRIGLSAEPERRHASLELLLDELEAIAARPVSRPRSPTRLAVLAGGLAIAASVAAFVATTHATSHATSVVSGPSISLATNDGESAALDVRGVASEPSVVATSSERRRARPQASARVTVATAPIAAALVATAPSAEQVQQAREAIESELGSTDELRTKRHLLEADLAGYAANRERARTAAAAGDIDGARRITDAMRAQINALRIDTAFIDAKTARLGQRAASVKLDAEQAKTLRTRLSAATSSAASNQLETANQHLTSVAGLLRIR